MVEKAKTGLKRSEAREALAAANADVATASQSSETARAAISRASDLVSKARAALDTAKEKAAEEKSARTAHIISAVTSGAVITQEKASRSAHREEADAADDLEEAEVALDAVKESFGNDHESELKRALARQKASIDAIILGEIKRQKQEIEKLAKPLAEKIAVLRFFATTLDYVPKNIDEIQALNRFQRQFIVPDHIVNQSGAEADAWRTAVDALKTDADAEMPK